MDQSLQIISRMRFGFEILTILTKKIKFNFLWSMRFKSKFLNLSPFFLCHHFKLQNSDISQKISWSVRHEISVKSVWNLIYLSQDEERKEMEDERVAREQVGYLGDSEDRQG